MYMILVEKKIKFNSQIPHSFLTYILLRRLIYYAYWTKNSSLVLMSRLGLLSWQYLAISSSLETAPGARGDLEDSVAVKWEKLPDLGWKN